MDHGAAPALDHSGEHELEQEHVRDHVGLNRALQKLEGGIEKGVRVARPLVKRAIPPGDRAILSAGPDER